MGCGKSSVGRKLSELLCCRFMDLDDMIEAEAGKSIPEIFNSEGEEAFRHLEKDTLINILESTETRQCVPSAPSQLSLGPSPYPGVGRCQFHTSALSSAKINILSLGGGTVMTRECAEIIRERTVCVYLRASVETLTEHLEGETQGRPMLNGNINERITALMAQRSSTYESTAHIIIDIDGKSVDEVAENIRNAIER